MVGVRVDNTGAMALGSHLAATAIEDVIYVYFRNNDNKLARVQSKPNDKWSEEQVISDFDVNADSSIALVPYTTAQEEKVIHHFFWNYEEIIHEPVSADEQ